MESNAFKNKLEQFRLHYKNTYGIEMDDETLYFFIRVNEMQIALSKKFDEQPKIKFDRGLDYFWYGLGSLTKSIFIIITFLISFSLLLKC
mgnify:FL=1